MHILSAKLTKLLIFFQVDYNSKLINDLKEKRLELEAKQISVSDSSSERLNIAEKQFNNYMLDSLIDLNTEIDELINQDKNKRGLIFDIGMDIAKRGLLTDKHIASTILRYTGQLTPQEIAEKFNVSLINQYVYESEAIPVLYDYLLERNLITPIDNIINRKVV
ncbi:MAG: hypothetical protein WBH77_06880 [Saccharofermentanales bacterium]